MRKTRLWAIVPVKDLEGAKQRLASVLEPRQRQALFRAMLQDVLETLIQTEQLAGTLMVTRDPWAGRFAKTMGVEVLYEQENQGQTAAVSFAARWLKRAGIGGMLTIPGDVPLLTKHELAQIAALHGPAPAVTIVPARDELGSNAIACSPPDVLALRFGDNSFFPHLESARKLGIEPQIVKLPGLALDIDRPDDLATFAHTPSATKTFAYLEQSGLIARIQRFAKTEQVS